MEEIDIMNFTYLVESGVYSKDKLTAEQKERIAGMEDALKEINLCIANEFENDEDTPLYEQALNSIRVEAAEECKEWISSLINESIVVMQDNNTWESEEQT